jgi:ATP-binding cassette subfamily F protein 3
VPSRAPAKKRTPRAGAVPSPPGADPDARLEQEIEAAEAALAALEDELADPAAWATPERTADSTRRHEQARRAVEQLYEQI